MAEELLKLYAARKAVPGHAFAADTHWQEEFEGAFEWDLTRRSGHGDRRHQARHGSGDADGPPALRRRRLRQDRSGDARRLQGGDGRQAGRRARADDGARLPAPRDAEASFRGVPGPDRHDQPRFRTKQEIKACARRRRCRPPRHPGRHAPAALEGRPVSRSRAARRRRGAALRRRAQGAHQADAQAG